jgi:hypothetical protein
VTPRPWIVALAVTACAHETPFAAGPYPPGGPFSPGAVSQLTFNLAADAMPALASDQSSVWYSFAPTERRDRDVCLGSLPLPGGSRVETRCWPTPAAEDSTDALEWSAPAADGRLAFVHTSGRRFADFPDAAELDVWSADGGSTQRVLRLPLRGRAPAFDRAAFIHWVDANTLVFVGQLWIFVRPFGVPDTLISGVSIERLTLGDPEPVTLAGTLGASALDLAPGSGILHYTLNGDSRVLALDLATGDTSTVWDFGAAGIARDPRVRGGRLLAVVGGDVTFAYDSIQDAFIQSDAGGYLHLVDLASGTSVVVGDTARRNRHPVLTADGRRAVVEVVDSRGNDLWRIDLP